MDTNDYLSLFIDESREHLQAMNDNMLALEQAPEDIAIVQNMFRSAHTLKGMSATMGFEDIASLTHKMENVLDLVRNGKLRMEEHIFDIIFQSLDALEAMLTDIIGGGDGKLDVTQIVTVLQQIAEGTYGQSSGSQGNAVKAAAATGNTDVARGMLDQLDEYQKTVILQSIEAGYRTYIIRVVIRQDCSMKAVRAYMVFESLGKCGEVLAANPPVEEIEADQFDYTFTLVFLSELEAAAIQAVVMNVSEIASAEVQTVTETELVQQMPAGNVSHRETAAAAATVTTDPVPAGKEPQAGSAVQKSSQKQQAAAQHRTIRVDIEKLDSLMNLFSEMLIDRVRLEQLAQEVKRSDLIETVEHMGRVSSDLQNIVMSLRMMPIESVFNRFPRMVRDVAKTLHKKVDLVMTGSDTELDRTVIDEIGDPLVHLLRNSVDHGVETPEERLKAGKSETGTIYLRAFQSGNHVIIETEDDGKGIQRHVILNKAVKNGLVTQEQGDAMSDDEVYQLLFASGFSTAEKVSDISGRGVGLDVVKSKITSLGGQVIVSSAPGRGTKFTIQLPLTLSIISAMLIKLGKETYAIPLSSIVETAIIKREAIRNVHGTKLFEFRSGMIPLISLSRLFAVPGFNEEEEEETEIVIVRKGERLAGIAVDELIGQQEIVLKSLGKYISNVTAISGATILGDGQVALIIDHNALMK